LQAFLSINTNFVTEVLSQSLTQNGTQLTGATAFVRTNIWGRGSTVEMNTSYVTQRTARELWLFTGSLRYVEGRDLFKITI
jgi:hypothetical protein